MLHGQTTLDKHSHLASHDCAPIGVQALATHEATILRSQKHKTGRHLAGLTGTTHGTGKLALGLVVHGRRDERRPDGTGTYGIDADVPRKLLLGEGAHESDNGAFGRRVVEQIGSTDVGINAGAGNDAVASVHVHQSVL